MCTILFPTILSERWSQCHRPDNPKCFYDLPPYLRFVGWEVQTLVLQRPYNCNMYFLYFLERTPLQLQCFTGSLEYYSQCSCVGDKGKSSSRRAAGAIWVMNSSSPPPLQAVGPSCHTVSTIFPLYAPFVLFLW